MPINVGAVGANRKVLASGTVTVSTAGVAVRMTTGNVPCSMVWVSADIGNTEGPMVVGDSNVVASSGSQRGIVVVPGNPPVGIEVKNLNLLYVDALTDGDKLCYVAVG